MHTGPNNQIPTQPQNPPHAQYYQPQTDIPLQFQYHAYMPHGTLGVCQVRDAYGHQGYIFADQTGQWAIENIGAQFHRDSRKLAEYEANFIHMRQQHMELIYQIKSLREELADLQGRLLHTQSVLQAEAHRRRVAEGELVSIRQQQLPPIHDAIPQRFRQPGNQAYRPTPTRYPVQRPQPMVATHSRQYSSTPAFEHFVITGQGLQHARQTPQRQETPRQGPIPDQRDTRRAHV